MGEGIPEGYHSVTPYITANDARAAIDFYKAVFGATERMRMEMDGGRIGHAEIQIGDSAIMLSDEAPDIGVFSPTHYGGSPITLHLYVEDVDAVVARAVAAGAKQTRPVSDQDYGDRNGTVVDPFGHRWFISTHLKDVPPAEWGGSGSQAG